MSSPDRPVRDEALLMELLFDVNQARARVRAGRRGRPGSVSSTDHQRQCDDLVEALRAYADAATSAGVPLPYRYRDEMRLYTAMQLAAREPRGR